MRITNLRIEKEQILLQTLLGIAAVLLLVFGISSLYTAWDGAPTRVQPDLNSVAITEPAALPEKEVAEETRPSEGAEEAKPVATGGGETVVEPPVEEQPATPDATA